MKCIIRLMIFGSILGLLTACNRLDPQAMAATSAAETEAAASPTPLPTDTPNPTATPTSTPTDTPTPTPTDTSTPTPTLTSTSTPDKTATQAALVTQEAEAMLAKIAPVLEQYKLSTAEGKLGWVQEEPLEIYVDTYRSMFWENLTPVNQVFSDFVLSIDITWASKMGFAVCGLMFLAEKDLQNGEQYQFNTLRLSGAPAWDVEFWEFNDWQYTATGDVRFNNAISLKDNSTNHYVLIYKDNLLTIYANDVRLGNVDVSKRNQGIFGALTWQDSGETTCIFSNGWIWSLK